MLKLAFDCSETMALHLATKSLRRDKSVADGPDEPVSCKIIPVVNGAWLASTKLYISAVSQGICTFI